MRTEMLPSVFLRSRHTIEYSRFWGCTLNHVLVKGSLNYPYIQIVFHLKDLPMQYSSRHVKHLFWVSRKHFWQSWPHS